jgi:hypothetical protein
LSDDGISQLVDLGVGQGAETIGRVGAIVRRLYDIETRERAEVVGWLARARELLVSQAREHRTPGFAGDRVHIEGAIDQDKPGDLGRIAEV